MTRRVLISPAYLEMLVRAMRPGEIVAVQDFPTFLKVVKDRLKGEGRTELFEAIVREEIHMIERHNEFV